MRRLTVLSTALALLAGTTHAADLPCPEGTYPIRTETGKPATSIELKRYPGECSVKVGNEWMTVLPAMVKALGGTGFQPGDKGTSQVMGVGGSISLDVKVAGKETVKVGGADIEAVKLEAVSSRQKDVWTAWYVPASGMIVRYTVTGGQAIGWTVTRMPAAR